MKKVSKNKLIVSIIIVIFILLGIVSEIFIGKYKNELFSARKLLKEEKYDEAIKKFNDLSEFKLSKIDTNNIRESINEAQEGLENEKLYMKADEELCSGELLAALKDYFLVKDEKSKVYKKSKERILDVFKLLLTDKSITEENKIDKIDNLVLFIDNSEKVDKNIYKEEIEFINKVNDDLKLSGLDSILNKNIVYENEFEIIDNKLNLIRDNKSKFVKSLSIKGEFSNDGRYFIYKIPMELAGKYKINISFKDKHEKITGELSDISNKLLIYDLGDKAEYGEKILLNLSVEINNNNISTSMVESYEKK